MAPVRPSSFALAVFLTLVGPSLSFSSAGARAGVAVRPAPLRRTPAATTARPSRSALHVLGAKEEVGSSPPSAEKSKADDAAAVPSVDETTEKYGLEAGLFQSLRSKDGGESAKSLLKKYGIAYLATSIPLAIVSFAICYVLVDNGVDVGGLLSRVGIDAGDAGEKAGTFAIAYAAHKAASPIRFPPTVILTPVVAKLIGKEPEEEEAEEGG